MNNIYVISHRPDKYTKICINSIIQTATPPFKITVIKHKKYAAQNKNMVLDISDTRHFFLVNDDILFYEKGWDTKLLESLKYSPNVSMVGCRVILPKNCYRTMSERAPINCLIDNIRIPDCVLAIKKTHIRFDEIYEVSQCDDIDFMLQNIQEGYKVLIDTRVSVKHMKIPCTIPHKFIERNLQAARKKWGNWYDQWGNDLNKIVVIKEFE